MDCGCVKSAREVGNAKRAGARTAHVSALHCAQNLDTESFTRVDEMKVDARLARWATVFSLAAACSGAGAQTIGAQSVVWIENESFDFNACPAASIAASVDEAAAAIVTLRQRATADIDAALRSAGVVLDGQRFMTITPLSGALACAGADPQITFRVSAVDRSVGKFWSADLTVRSEVRTSDRETIAGMGIDLAQFFRTVQYKSAKL
jgi:hypothetical protein